ncbi:type III-B CRISPR module RAMP protein Cmr4 [Salinactinospora qingdaonensis]|uniref:Type III-B CRISPR module RAMP protein Cmr4 n=1 Tax=Salinactinospora qingdaonensis TaxID=702744 RepID=A0ABP7F638_9ACTN
MTSFLLYLYAESPLHPGAATGDGALDLPIQRESATNYPLMWGQSLKGALRQAARESGWESEHEIQVFGSEVGHEEEGDSNGETTPGRLAVGDAQLVALPVPTLRRSFAWATSTLALSRLARKYAIIGRADAAPEPPAPEDSEGMAGAHVWGGTMQEVLGPCLVHLTAPPGGGQQPPNAVARWAELLADDAVGDAAHMATFTRKLREDLLVVGADTMTTLLRECTEFAVRVQLETEAKKVRNGPFTSEYLPAETILAAVVTLREKPASANTARLRALLDGALLRVGGDETIGKGMAWTRIIDGGGRG